MGLVYTDEEMQEILDEKKHSEIKSLLVKLIGAISESNKSGDIVSAINRNNDKISAFVSAIQNIKVDSPNVNVETNQDKVVQQLANIAKDINNNLISLREAVLKEKPKESKEYEFSFRRNEVGYLQSPIKAKQIN